MPSVTRTAGSSSAVLGAVNGLMGISSTQDPKGQEQTPASKCTEDDIQVTSLKHKEVLEKRKNNHKKNDTLSMLLNTVFHLPD